MMLRVAIVDDQELVRTGFAMILGSEPDIEVVGQAGNGRDAIELCRRIRPDVVLMDIRMPEMDGIEATRQIVVDAATDTRVLMLTTFDLDDYVYSAIKAGASGFLLKDTPADDLVKAVKVIAAGDALLAPSVTRRLITEFASESSSYSAAPGLEHLTDRETEVLELLARGRSNQEIAAELFLGETTVKTHVSRVLAKLEVRDRVQAVIMAYESGLIRPGRDDGAAGPATTA
jgi:DNA-binding NarL/FixJ family response regulator